MLKIVRRWQQNWKQMLEEMSNKRVTKKVHDDETQEDALKGDPETDEINNFDQLHINTYVLLIIMYSTQYVYVYM